MFPDTEDESKYEKNPSQQTIYDFSPTGIKLRES